MQYLRARYEDDEDEIAGADEHEVRRGLRSASFNLAEVALEEVFRPFGARAISRPGMAVVIKCPNASWVEPLREAALRAGWVEVYARTGASRLEERPDKGNSSVMKALASGRRVLGISQDPGSYLPSALIVSADLVATLESPSGRLIGRVIRAASGRSAGRVEDGLASSLTYEEIAAQIRGGTSPASSLKRLRAAAAAKVAADPAVAQAPPFEELAGYGEAHDWGMALIGAVRSWRRGDVPLSSIASRHAVLASEPGLGKTTMCRSLARSAGLRLVSTSVAGWFAGSNGKLDGVVKAAQAAFEAATAAAPSLLLLDELDALPARGGLSADEGSWWATAVTGVLLNIDAVVAHPSALVAVVGATNHPERLDPALVRPGRLDRVIHLRRPDAISLVKIVRTHLGNDLAEEDLGIVGEVGVGATGASAAGWVARARARAASERRPMALADLLGEIAPPDTRSAMLVRRIAIHEAAHAVAVELLGTGRVRSISIVQTGEEGGRVTQEERDADMPIRPDIEAEVVALLAARAAEALVFGAASTGSGGGVTSDLARATELVAGLNGVLGMGGRLTYRGFGQTPADSRSVTIRCSRRRSKRTSSASRPEPRSS